eukprot:m.185582 g.185582  ORF g.185582 m.185582 type:complete len:317 (+) comp15032_c0_seq1:178-1128(+)
MSDDDGAIVADPDGFMSFGATLAQPDPIGTAPTADPSLSKPRPLPPRPRVPTGRNAIHDNPLARRRAAEGAGDFRSGGSLLWHAINDGERETVAALLAAQYDVTLRHHNNESPLHLAIRLGDAASAIQLLEHGADPSQLGPSGYAALHYAAHFDQPSLASVLIQQGVELDAANGVTGQSALYIAARGGSTATMGLLIQHGAATGVREANMKRTAAHAAAERNHPDILQLLIESHADLNVVDAEGYTPLQLAAKAGANAAVTALLSAPGVNSEQRMGWMSWVGGGWTAADLAADAGHHAVAHEIRRAASPESAPLLP